jgi:6-phosphogluconolactonase
MAFRFFSIGLFVVLLGAALTGQAALGETFRVYVGTYTGGESKGIYRLDFDTSTGALSNRQLAAEVASPSFLATDPTRRFLFAVNEVMESDGKKTGAVTAFAIDPATGVLTLLNHQPSGGPGPCHLAIDREGKNVLVANYAGGSVAVLPIRSDGKLGEATATIQHRGTSINPQRQEAPHAHCANFDAANRFAFIADLGLDKVMIYRFNPSKGTLTPNDPPSAAVKPGSGPRHFAFHPDGRHAYVINELGNTVTAFDYDPSTGVLTPRQSLSTLPNDFHGTSYTAEIQVHPSGAFLYGSNRGHNSIAVFAIDPRSGELTATGHQGREIKTPRNFAIDPTGRYLVVANQDSASLVVFAIDPKTGALVPVGDKVSVPKPVCVEFVPKGK